MKLQDMLKSILTTELLMLEKLPTYLGSSESTLTTVDITIDSKSNIVTTLVFSDDTYLSVINGKSTFDNTTVIASEVHMMIDTIVKIIE
jgi:hypothetical protein